MTTTRAVDEKNKLLVAALKRELAQKTAYEAELTFRLRRMDNEIAKKLVHEAKLADHLEKLKLGHREPRMTANQYQSGGECRFCGVKEKEKKILHCNISGSTLVKRDDDDDELKK